MKNAPARSPAARACAEVVDRANVRQRQPRYRVSLRGKAYLDPADRTANPYVAARNRGGSQSVIVPPALPSNWYRPPSFRSPLTGRNQRGGRSGLVTASHRSSTVVSYVRLQRRVPGWPAVSLQIGLDGRDQADLVAFVLEHVAHQPLLRLLIF